MEDQNKEVSEGGDSASPSSSSQGDNTQPHSHVRIFGAEVNAGPQGNRDEWKKHREEWKAERHARRAEWKAQRDAWRNQHHEGRIFGGLILLLVGVLALFYTLGFVSPEFWRIVVPFWPVLIILWGASMILGRHWFARFIIFLLALAFIVIVVVYGLVRAGSPLANSFPPGVVNTVQNSNPPYNY